MGHSRDRVFLSYSHEDKGWLERLVQALAVVGQGNPETVWWDGRIKAGQEWREEIDHSLATARVGIFLVSPGFLASEFILKNELPALLAAAQSDGVAILWTLVRNCWWEQTPLARFQAVGYQETQTVKAWNALSEPELDDLLRILAQTVAEHLNAPASAARKAEADIAGLAAATAGSRERPAGAAPSPRVDARETRRLLADVEDVETVREIGELFVLRGRWAAAVTAFDRLVELAAPDDELAMAWAYENLGRIRRREADERRATECFRLARVLYGRFGKPRKAEEMTGLLETAPPAEPAASGVAGQVTAPAATRQPDALQS